MSGRVALAALALLTLARLAVSALVPLAPDEAYYWVWSRALAPGYLDHPPMVALFIRAGTWIAGETPLGVRLAGPLAAALGTVLLARAADDLFPDRRPGVRAGVLLNATLLLGAGAVVATPDTPLLLFWTATLWAAARLLRTGDGRWWLVAGLCAGLALASKYTAGLLGLGLLAWLLACRDVRPWLGRWQPWAGGGVALLVFSPVVAWNAARGWASFAKQGGRAGSAGAGEAGVGAALRYLGELAGSQAALATPLVLALMVAGTAAAARRWGRGDAAAGLLAALVLPGAALFAWQATGDRVQGNWPAVLYPGAALAAAAFAPRRWDRAAVALGLGLTALVWLQAVAAPLPLPRRLDPTLARAAGWDAFALEVEAARVATGAGYVAAEEYGLAARLAFALPPGVPVVGIGDRWRLFDLPGPPGAGAPGLLVRSLRRGEGPTPWPAAGAALGTLARTRDGVEAERYRLHRVLPGPVPAATLPRPGNPGAATGVSGIGP